MIYEAGTSHIASNFSVIDIATVLYDNLKDGDDVVWSKGWASASIYYFLAQQGKIPKDDLDKFGKEIDGQIPYLGLAETTVPGVWCNGGSVGHGLPIAVGMALGKKLKGEDGKTYCILSDGELNEGSVWEAMMFASHHQLDNLVAIVDKNGWQAMGRTEDVVDIANLNRVLNGFNWESIYIDGHNYEQIDWALKPEGMRLDRTEYPIRNAPYLGWKSPTMIIAKTIKGKGVSAFEDHLLFHYKHVEKSDYEKALAELS